MKPMTDITVYTMHMPLSNWPLPPVFIHHINAIHKYTSRVYHVITPY